MRSSSLSGDICTTPSHENLYDGSMDALMNQAVHLLLHSVSRQRLFHAENLDYVTLNGATDMPLIQQTPQTHYYSLLAALSGATGVSLLHQPPHYNIWPAASSAAEVHQMPHYDGPTTRWVDFIWLHRRQLIYAARLRWPMPLIMSRVLCVVLPHA